MTRVRYIHTMRHFAGWCRKAVKEEWRFVSAGEVAKLTGVSVKTARKWLDKSVQEGELETEPKVHTNGVKFIAYGLTSLIDTGLDGGQL